MAVPFLSLRANSAPRSVPFSLSLPPTTVSSLCTSFRSCESLLPLFFLGPPDFLSSKLLSALISSSPHAPECNIHPSNLSPDSFDEVEGLAVWPHPVYIGTQATLVLRMWDFDVMEREGEEWEVVRRALVSGMQAAAYCFVSFYQGSKFKGLEAVQEIYEELRARTGIEICRFFYLESPSKTYLPGSSMLKQSAAYDTKPYSQYTTFITIPTACDLTELAQSLIGRYPARRHLATLASSGSPIKKICEETDIIAKVSNLNLTFSAFLDLIPLGPRKTTVEEKLKSMGEMHLQLSQATVRPLFRPGMEGGYEVDDKVLDLVRANFDPEKPTVVMVVLGGQGTGKSTFCNHLIQHCSQSRTCHDYFTTGNTTTHTTSGSHFLTAPLCTPSQLLLIDMEGLGGSETTQQKAALLQSSHVGAVLAVASVPCFLVRNEVSIFRDVERYMEKLVWLSRNLGFRMERILFLFHDKDLSSSLRTENLDISQWIQQLNRLYFNDSPVILLLNKPNFADSSKSDMCKAFLSQMLSKAGFPKRGISGECLNIRNLLVQIRYMGEGLERDTGNLTLEAKELRRLTDMEQEKKEELERLVQNLQSSGMSLVLLFNEKSMKFLASLDNSRESPKVKRRLRAFVRERIGELRWSLTATEALYTSLSALNDSQLQAKIKEKVQKLYSEAFCLQTFLPKCNFLAENLNKVAVHYPHMRSRIDLACSCLDEEKASSKWKSALNYTVNVGLAVATGGLGAAASGARLAVTAARYGWAAFGVGGLSAVKYGTELISNLKSKKPDQMLQIKGERLQWNAKAVQGLSKGGDKCVVLVLGREGMGIAKVLNSTLASLSGMELNEAQSLASSDCVQVVTCAYPTRQCECLMFYLQFSASAKQPSDSTVSSLASALFPAVSCVCIFNGQENDHLMNIVSTGLNGCERNRPVLAVFTMAGGSREHESALRKLIWDTELSTVYKEVSTLTGRDKEMVQTSFTERLLDARVIPPREIERMMNEAKRRLREVLVD